MKVIIDNRNLDKYNFSGVRLYNEFVYEGIENKCDVVDARPKTKRLILRHLWGHSILPFYKGDLIFCPSNIGPVYTPRSKKLIVTLHDVAFLKYPQFFSKSFVSYYKKIIPYILKRADGIITVSHFSKNEIIKYFPAYSEKIKVIYPGSNYEKIKEPQVKEKYILFVGSFNQRKNFVGVVKAFNKINDPNLKLAIVGNYSSIFELDSMAVQIIKNMKNDGKIIFHENISFQELKEVYMKSLFLIFPSFYEGFGLPCLEAMNLGTPVITSKNSSMEEVCSSAALYCNPEDENEISKVMESLLKDKEMQSNLIHKGFERSMSFSWEECCKKHLEFFEAVMSK